jgi:hypothetical protein
LSAKAGWHSNISAATRKNPRNLSNPLFIIATLQKKRLGIGLNYQILIARLVSQITQPRRAARMKNTYPSSLVAAQGAWFALAMGNYPFKTRLFPNQRKQDHEPGPFKRRSRGADLF